MKDQRTALKAIASQAQAGTATTALLSGAAGVAGARAAETVAADLGATVHRIDLAAVISKYAGEAEKTLGLLFADAGALLARIESYNGVVLLATNLSTNIDPSFSRRLRRVIDYTPD